MTSIQIHYVFLKQFLYGKKYFFHLFNIALPPLEPPIIEYNPYLNIDKPDPASLKVSSRLVQAPPGTSLKVIFTNIREGFLFNQGDIQRDGKVVVDVFELANLTITSPPGFSGYLNLTITAVAAQGGRNASRAGKIFVYFKQGLIVENEPALTTRNTCVNYTAAGTLYVPLQKVLEVHGYMKNSSRKYQLAIATSEFKLVQRQRGNSDILSNNNGTTFSPDELQLFILEIEKVGDDFTLFNVTVHLLELPSNVTVDTASFMVSLCQKG